jgi:hypothetical protein
MTKMIDLFSNTHDKSFPNGNEGGPQAARRQEMAKTHGNNPMIPKAGRCELSSVPPASTSGVLAKVRNPFLNNLQENSVGTRSGFFQ